VPTSIELSDIAGQYRLTVVKAESKSSVGVYPIWIGRYE